MNEKVQNSILETLERNQSNLMQTCNKNCRYAIGVIVGTTWGLLIEKHLILLNSNGFWGTLVSEILLIATLILSVAFLIVDAWRQCNLAEKMRDIHNHILKGDIDNEIQAIAYTNEESDKAFHLFKAQLTLCMISVVLLLVYVIIFICMK